jgi:hypothetical protein
VSQDVRSAWTAPGKLPRVKHDLKDWGCTMKLSVISLALAVASVPASAQRNERGETGAVDRACTVKDCFLEAEIRDFEVVDRTHVIVYVGAQRCAFHVEVRGTLCDLTFAPELYFRRANELPIERGGSIAGGGTTPRSSRPTDFGTFDIATRERRDLRICANDLSIQVHGGAFTETASSGSTVTDRFGNPRTDCVVSGVTSVTDDQLLEFYVTRGVVSPVPPMGTGEIEVGEQDEPASAAQPSDQPEQGAAPPGRRRRSSGNSE